MSDLNNPAEHILQLAKQSKKAARELAAVSGEGKAAALTAMVDALYNARSELARANAADLEDARIAVEILRRSHPGLVGPGVGAGGTCSQMEIVESDILE